VKKRLRRIEGQVRGVAKMLDEGRECQEILQQLSAIRSAVQQASVTLARSYACECLSDPKKNQDALVEELLSVFSKAG
jgi:DNA-binding FrmR family transcriptional regulator